jgi:hypothetical protein
MSTNPYFRQFRVRSERDLIDDLLQEAIQIHGIDVVYLPRSKQKYDLVFGEDTLSKFDDYYDIEIYVESSSFEGATEHITKFGLEIEDQIKIAISKTRFDKVTNYEIISPTEGDLIYDAVTNSLWEIKFSDDDERWFQLGDLPIYTVNLAKFVYGNEKIDTGLFEIDKLEEDYSSSIVLQFDTTPGNFIDNEWVFQGSSLLTATAKGEVVRWDYTDDTLKIINMVGEFNIADGVVTGATSGVSKTLSIEPSQIENTQINDFSDNKKLEDEGSGYLDFSEDDIFGFLKDN